MGVQALKSHADGKKHKEVVAAVSVFFKKSTKSQNTSSERSRRNASSSTEKETLELTVNKPQVSIAEIRWALHTVAKGHSKSSINNITELFKVMFSHSQIAKMFIVGADKTRYIISWYCTISRRDDYICVTGSTSFPHYLGTARWVESKGVAERAKSLWEHVVKIVNFSKKLPKSKQPKCDSYDIVKDAADDPLTVAKLEFFVYVAGLLESLL